MQVSMRICLKELGASGIVINPLGVSYYVPVDIMKQLITM